MNIYANTVFFDWICQRGIGFDSQYQEPRMPGFSNGSYLLLSYDTVELGVKQFQTVLKAIDFKDGCWLYKRGGSWDLSQKSTTFSRFLQRGIVKSFGVKEEHSCIFFLPTELPLCFTLCITQMLGAQGVDDDFVLIPHAMDNHFLILSHDQEIIIACRDEASKQAMSTTIFGV